MLARILQPEMSSEQVKIPHSMCTISLPSIEIMILKAIHPLVKPILAL